MEKQNTTAVLTEPKTLKFENRTIPVPKKGEVLLRISKIGLCGSDIHYWWHGRNGRFVVESPLVLGHESSAHVIKCGNGIKILKEGDRVAIEPGIPCRLCRSCKTGRYNVCDQIRFCATPPVDGTLTQYFCHPYDFCYKLPPSVSDEEGALLEPLNVALYSCRRAEVGIGSRVLVTGAGPVGIMVMMVAKALGAKRICLTDVNKSRLIFAKDLGADGVIHVEGNISPEAVVKEVKVVLGGGANAVVECCGAEDALKLGILAGSLRCILVTVGRGPSDVKLPVVMVTAKEMDIRGIFRYANCYSDCLSLVKSGALKLNPLITHRFPLSEVESAFHTALKGKSIKVMIDLMEDTN